MCAQRLVSFNNAAQSLRPSSTARVQPQLCTHGDTNTQDVANKHLTCDLHTEQRVNVHAVYFIFFLIDKNNLPLNQEEMTGGIKKEENASSTGRSVLSVSLHQGKVNAHKTKNKQQYIDTKPLLCVL